MTLSQPFDLLNWSACDLGGQTARKIKTTLLPQYIKKMAFQSEVTCTGSAYLPDELFSTEALGDPKTLGLLILGGFLVGFGTRYAGGCTSGHAISGLSNLQMPSLIAVIGFFAGGLLMVHFIFPLLF